MTADIWTQWDFRPTLSIPLAASAALYGRGQMVRPLRTPYQTFCFWAGWTILALALISPVHELGESLFSAHMLQHELLMLAAAPLLVLSRPLAPLLWGLPMNWRRAVGRASKLNLIRIAWSRITRPRSAWLIHAVALWLWHYPPLFDGTVSHEWIHALQHASFFFSALLFWWALFDSRASGAGIAGVVYLFTTAVHTSILGALLTLSQKPWYSAYATSTTQWGLSRIEDQQLGGLIMWIPASLVYIAAGLAILAACLNRERVAHA